MFIYFLFRFVFPRLCFLATLLQLSSGSHGLLTIQGTGLRLGLQFVNDIISRVINGLQTPRGREARLEKKRIFSQGTNHDGWPKYGWTGSYKAAHLVERCSTTVNGKLSLGSTLLNWGIYINTVNLQINLRTIIFR